MFWLALAGIVLTLGGAAVSAIGAVKQGQQEADKAELEAQRLRENIPLLEEQKRVQQADIGLKQSGIALQQKVLSNQALETARAGGAAKGMIAARAGAGSLGGASPLRQSMEVQRRTQETLGINRMQKGLLGQQSEFVSLAGEAGISQTEFNIRWAGLGAEQKEKEAEWAEQYGWLSALGYGLSGAGQVIGTTDWSLFKKK